MQMLQELKKACEFHVFRHAPLCVPFQGGLVRKIRRMTVAIAGSSALANCCEAGFNPHTGPCV